MSTVTSIGTYLPCWGSEKARTAGDDEDAVTLAVAAGLAALARVDQGAVAGAVQRVVLVSRDLPLLEGGNSAPVLAGLGLSDHTPVSEVIGGAPVALDAVASAAPGTLVIGSDVHRGGAGAAAALIGDHGAMLSPVDGITRSLPVNTRDSSGNTTDYADPRLLRVRGVGESLDRLDQAQPVVAVAGLVGRDAASIAKQAPALATNGASSPLFALAAMIDGGLAGRVAAIEQATVTIAELGGGGDVAVHRDERPPRPVPKGTFTPGSDLPVSLSAYDRAFDPKLRLEAARCTACGTLSYPPRFRCISCGAEQSTEPVALPRHAEIYTLATIRVPVPGLISPYTVTLVELGDSGVRVLVRLTGAEAGSVSIGDRGQLVLRLVVVRSGVPDYGYGFLPDEQASETAAKPESSPAASPTAKEVAA